MAVTLRLALALAAVAVFVLAVLGLAVLVGIVVPVVALAVALAFDFAVRRRRAAVRGSARVVATLRLAHLALERVELRRAGLDAHALGDHAPALALVLLVVARDVAAGAMRLVGECAGVVDVARFPAALVEQVVHQVARRTEAVDEVVHEII